MDRGYSRWQTIRDRGPLAGCQRRIPVVCDEKGFGRLPRPGWRAFATRAIACEDIHERKQAQGRLQQTEQRWQTAFENSAIGIMMRDRADRFLAANRAFRNMLGYTDLEL